MSITEDLPPEVTDERIYEDLKAYQDAGLTVREA